MKNRDVFSLAMALLAESGDRYSVSEYEERAGYLIPAFCIEVRSISNRLALLEGGAPYGEIPPFVSLDEEFPVKDALVPAAAAYLAAMLVLAEDGALSDTLFARYCDAASSVREALTARIERIRDLY